ncbi:MAG TPA: nuclear transport factor 2 family protein [Gaiellaceae bacterium]|nr:nuclear transport factor 2 family protein [Gaiellaceae bacterium]
MNAGQAVWHSVNAIYAAYLAGDREAIDANISPDATIWDSSHEGLLRGKDQLDAVRDARPADGPKPSNLEAVDPVIDVYGNIAVVRHILLVTFPPEANLPQERIRNTSVWRKTDGRWLCIHNHEDVVS